MCDGCPCLARGDDDNDELVRGRNRLLSAHVSLFVVEAGIMVADSGLCFCFVIVVGIVVVAVDVDVDDDDGADMDLVPLEGFVGAVEEDEDGFVDLLDDDCLSFFFFLPRDDRLRCGSISIHDGFSLPGHLAGCCCCRRRR